MAFGNTGLKYVGNDGSIKLVESPGTPAAVAHVVEFEAVENPPLVDLSEMGAAFQESELGQKVWEITGRIWKAKGGTLLRAAKYDGEFIYEDGTIDGKLVGTFNLIPTLSKRLNTGTMYSFRATSTGVVTNTEGTV